MLPFYSHARLCGNGKLMADGEKLRWELGLCGGGHRRAETAAALGPSAVAAFAAVREAGSCRVFADE